jgi:hypothetical protein
MPGMSIESTPEDAEVIEFPADVHVFDVDDDLPLPEANETGDQTGGMGPL